MRLFYAVKIPAAVKEQLGEFVGGLSSLPGRVKWVSPGNMHLTLKFLGETSPEMLEGLRSAAAAAAAAVQPFKFIVSGCGAFPNLRSPRVFWVGIRDEEKRLQYLQKTLDYNLGQLGIERETRKFSPHLTVGRVKDQAGLAQLKDAYARAQFPAVTVDVAGFFLIESKLRPTGPIYTDLMSFPLWKGSSDG